MRLTYANVISTIFVFLALGAATAFAANQIVPKKSVGAKQLKSSAVTAAKIKKNAVTRVKIKKDAVDGSKIADGSVTGTEINAASTPFSRIVHEARGTATVQLPSGGASTVYPLSNPTYTQEAGSDDSYVGALDVTFEPSCEPPRGAIAIVTIDPPDPTNPDTEEAVAAGEVIDEAGGQVSKRVNLGPYQGSRFQTATPNPHTISLSAQVVCKSGNGVSATFGAVDVIGVK